MSIASLLALAGPAGFAQEARTGVSHPDDAVILATQDAPSQPVPAAKPSAARYDAVPSPEPTLRAATEPAAEPNRLADLDAGIVTRVAGPANALPAGTLMKVRLSQNISSQGTAPGSEFAGEIAEPLLRDGRVLLPAGTLFTGRIAEAHPATGVAGAAFVRLQTLNVTLPDGTHYPIHAQLIDTSLYNYFKVDREGTITHRAHPKASAAVLGVSTSTGLVTGAAVGGPAGAAVGATIGAGVGTALWLHQSRQVNLPEGTIATFSLDIPLMVDAR